MHDKLPGLPLCPACGKPVPANEYAAYYRHEDCAIPEPWSGSWLVRVAAETRARLEANRGGGRPADGDS